MTDAAYPPEPWYLGGSLLVSVFAVPQQALPPEFSLPEGRRPLRVGSRVIVGVAAARYVPGGALAYDELLVAVLSVGCGARRGARRGVGNRGLRVTIPQIWVDSSISLRGGRELWGIPKQLARFDRTDTPAGRTRMSMVAEGSAGTGRNSPRLPTVELRARRGLPLLPGLRQLALPILQRLDGRVILSHNRVIGRMSGLRASWRFAAGGALGYLSGRRPLFTIALHDASIVFGMDVHRPPHDRHETRTS